MANTEKYHQYGPLKMLRFQEDVEKNVYNSVESETQMAPAQRLSDFITNTSSKDLPKTSFIPGIISKPLHEILPRFVVDRLQKGFIEFNKKLMIYHFIKVNSRRQGFAPFQECQFHDRLPTLVR